MLVRRNVCGMDSRRGSNEHRNNRHNSKSSLIRIHFHLNCVGVKYSDLI